MSRRRRVKISFFFSSTLLVNHRRQCLTAFGDPRPHIECPQHVQATAVWCWLWPPVPAESANCFPRKTEYSHSDSVSARLWRASPRRDSIRKFQPVPGGYSITHFAPRTYPSVGRKEPRHKINCVSNWRAGPLNVRGVRGFAPTWFGRSSQSKGCCTSRVWDPKLEKLDFI